MLTRQAIEQVARLLSHQDIDVSVLAVPWVPESIGSSQHVVVTLGRTDFDADDQIARTLNLAWTHGRATPPLWLTVMQDHLHDRPNAERLS